MEDDFSIFHTGNFLPFPFHTKNLPFHTKIFFHIPFHTSISVEASHANAHARAIAFFSYIWFKYDILSLHCCKLGSVVVIALSSQPSAPGFNLQLGCACVMQDVAGQQGARSDCG